MDISKIKKLNTLQKLQLINRNLYQAEYSLNNLEINTSVLDKALNKVRKEIIDAVLFNLLLDEEQLTKYAIKSENIKNEIVNTVQEY